MSSLRYTSAKVRRPHVPALHGRKPLGQIVPRWFDEDDPVLIIHAPRCTELPPSRHRLRRPVAGIRRDGAVMPSDPLCAYEPRFERRTAD
jgi:hypothetical protein